MDRTTARLLAWGGVFILIDLQVYRYDLVPDLVGAILVGLAVWRWSDVLPWTPLLAVPATLLGLTSVAWWLVPPERVIDAATAHLLAESVLVIGLGAAYQQATVHNAARLRAAGMVFVGASLLGWVVGWTGPQGAAALLVVVSLVRLGAAIVWIVTAFQAARDGAIAPLPALPEMP